MRFITAVEQLKEANSAISVDFELDSIASYINEVENTLIFIIGEQASNEIEAFPRALETIRRAIVDLALFSYSSSGAVEISNIGITVSKSDKYLPASDKKLLNFRMDAGDRGSQAVEQSIAILQPNAIDLPLLHTPQKRNDYFSTLCFDSGEISAFGVMGIAASLFRVLRPISQRVQEDELYQD